MAWNVLLPRRRVRPVAELRHGYIRPLIDADFKTTTTCLSESPDLSSGSWSVSARCEVHRPACQILYRLTYQPTQIPVLFENYVMREDTMAATLGSQRHQKGLHPRNRQMALSRLCPGPRYPEGVTCSCAGGCGDFDVFVDDDGQATSSTDVTLDFDRTFDPRLYDSPEGANATGPDYFNATVFPIISLRRLRCSSARTSIMLYGHCCCFCFQGSGTVFTADSGWGLGYDSLVATWPAQLRMRLMHQSTWAGSRPLTGLFANSR